MSKAKIDHVGTVFDDPMPELTRVYADAFLGAAVNSGHPEETVAELEAFVRDVWVPNPDFAAILDSPSVDTQQRDAILVQALTGNASERLIHFLRVLNRHNRFELVAPIARHARSEWDRRQGRRPVHVRSAVPLDADQMARLQEYLSRVLKGSTPVMTYQVDPSLIGGMIVQVGDVVYDASVRTRYLETLRTRLVEESTHTVLALRDQFTAA